MYGYFSYKYEKNKIYKTPQEIETYIENMKKSKHYKRLLGADDISSKRELREWNVLIRKFRIKYKRPSDALRERRRHNSRKWRSAHREHISDYNKSAYRQRCFFKKNLLE